MIEANKQQKTNTTEVNMTFRQTIRIQTLCLQVCILAASDSIHSILIMAGVYNMNIPASGPLANVDANHLVPLAPAILAIAGQIRTLADVDDAIQESINGEETYQVGG
jgi:hypothetical protein